MAKSAKQVQQLEREEFEELLTDVCVAFGYAMRHTMINHKTKSEEGWRKFAKALMRFADATN